MTSADHLYEIALTRIDGIGCATQRGLLDRFGSAEAVFAADAEALHAVELRPALADLLLEGKKEALARAERECAFLARVGADVLALTDDDYPFRLRECPDAPVVLYYKGRNVFSARHMLSIVGTRHVTSYGREACERFVARLAELYPDTVVVSGLATGVDVCAHRAALRCGLPTVGVMATSVDKVYPSAHRTEVRQMLEAGGAVCTEFESTVGGDKSFFIQRNRIIAGMSEGTLVVESAKHGGAMSTAAFALDYNRTVMAFPGRLTDMYSQGCHKLISRHIAELCVAADDLVEFLRWTPRAGESQPQAVQRSLFDETMSTEERAVLQALGREGMHINDLCRKTGMPFAALSSLLMKMEFDGRVKSLPGGRFEVGR